MAQNLTSLASSVLPHDYFIEEEVVFANKHLTADQVIAAKPHICLLCD
jgi:hypothetical protein